MSQIPITEKKHLSLFSQPVWILFIILCVSIGLYPLAYAIIPLPFGLLTTKAESLLQNSLWSIMFITHILFGGFSLLTGFSQFSKVLRSRRPDLHRILGSIYVGSVLFSSLAGIYIGFFATGGWISATGFILLGVIWFSSTGMAWFYIKKRDFRNHEKWMIFSFSAAFAAVTLRLWMPLTIWLSGSFITGYQIVAWLCWVPNILFAWILTSRRPLGPTEKSVSTS